MVCRFKKAAVLTFKDKTKGRVESLNKYREMYGFAIELARGWHNIIAPYLSESGRRKLYNKCGAEAFLLIEHKRGKTYFKFPIADPKTCEPSPKGVAAAFLRAYMLREMGEKYQKVLDEAYNLLEDYKEHGKITKKPTPIIVYED